jgi:adenylyltransferase/sulfurtransferase
VKLILGIGEPLVGRLLLYDALGMRFRELKLRKNPDCPVCGERRTITRLIDYHQFCGVPGPGNTPPAAPERPQEVKVKEGEIDVTELKEKLDRGDNFVLIDVREPHEYRICNIPGSRLIPLGEFPKHVGELDPQADIVIHCKSGMRSARACAILRQAGFQHVRNVAGGILAWSDKVDSSVPKY